MQHIFCPLLPLWKQSTAQDSGLASDQSRIVSVQEEADDSFSMLLTYFSASTPARFLTSAAAKWEKVQISFWQKARSMKQQLLGAETGPVLVTFPT